MRLLHFADLHIGMTNYSKIDPDTGLESRLLDFFKTLDFIVDTAIKESVDCVLFAGDTYKTRDPSPTQQRGFGQRMKKLTKNKIPVILVVGNHDTPNVETKANTLDIYCALEVDNIYVFRKPELAKIETKSGPLQIVAVPWLQKAEYKTIGEKLVGFYQKLKTNTPAVLVGHLEVKGALYGSEKGLAIASDITMPLSLLTDRKLSYVALGHIHKHQVLSNPPTGGPLVVYSGSPERIDFGEEKEEKGICLVEIIPVIPAKAGIHTNKNGPMINSEMTAFDVNFQFIPTNARKFLTITVDLKGDDQNPTQTILDMIKKHNLENTIIRVYINIPEGLDKEIEMDKVKKALSSANFIAGISRNVERVERLKMDGTDEVERLTPIEALHIYFEAKKLASARIKELERYAEQLLE